MYLCYELMKHLLRYFLVFVFTIFLASCENDIEKVKLLGQHEQSPIESAKNIKIIYSDSARVEVELTAPVMNRYASENPYMEMPKGFRAIFYDDALNESSRVTADYGIRYERDMKMEARKNVVVINEKGEKLNTEHLTWDERRGKLLSDEFVTITQKDEIIYGTGFEANQDFTKYKIFNIKGTISVNKEKK
jgi:LPS export ABC transporter protein LptC